jgi:hypothetical protein
MSKIKKEKERDVIMQKGVLVNLMVITSTRLEPSVHLTIEDHVWFEDRWMVASLCDE